MVCSRRAIFLNRHVFIQYFVILHPLLAHTLLINMKMARFNTQYIGLGWSKGPHFCTCARYGQRSSSFQFDLLDFICTFAGGGQQSSSFHLDYRYIWITNVVWKLDLDWCISCAPAQNWIVLPSWYCNCYADFIDITMVKVCWFVCTKGYFGGQVGRGVLEVHENYRSTLLPLFK